MSLSVYQSRVRMLEAQLPNAKTDSVRAVLLKQLNDTKREIKKIKSEGAKQWAAELEAKYANVEHTNRVDIESDETETVKNKRAKKGAE